MKNTSKVLIIFGVLALIFAGFFYLRTSSIIQIKTPIWKVRSIDTVKYSRDLAREKMNDENFDLTIIKQVKDIKSTGANYIAIGTPYDDEFTPFLEKWVSAARKNGLNIWFRGNFSGWEEWFGYSSIDRFTHLAKTEDFILNNPDLFADGDIFTSCPECENGGSGDPRKTGDVTGFRQFLVDEYKISKSAFEKIQKKVDVGYFSMNYDVANLIMDPPTTASLGGIVAIDHYVTSPEKIAEDARKISLTSGGKVVLGEFGAPIPDLNGNMTEEEQADWIDKALVNLTNTPEIVGINYWVNVGGSTQIWEKGGKPKKAVEILKKYFNLANISN